MVYAYQQLLPWTWLPHNVKSLLMISADRLELWLVNWKHKLSSTCKKSSQNAGSWWHNRNLTCECVTSVIFLCLYKLPAQICSLLAATLNSANVLHLHKMTIEIGTNGLRILFLLSKWTLKSQMARVYAQIHAPWSATSVTAWERFVECSTCPLFLTKFGVNR